MRPQKPISLLTRRAEEVAMCSHMLEEHGIKPMSITITENYALICISRAPMTKKIQGKTVGSTWVKGALYVVHQALVNNVIIKWLEPYFDAQLVAQKVH